MAAELPLAGPPQPLTVSYSAGRIQPTGPVPSEAPRRAPEQEEPLVSPVVQPTGSAPIPPAQPYRRSPRHTHVVAARSFPFFHFAMTRIAPMGDFARYR